MKSHNIQYMKIQNSRPNSESLTGRITMEQDVELNKSKYFACFFICGLINNSAYVMVGTAAQEVAHHFQMDRFMGAFNLSLIVFAIFLVAANANLFINISHLKRTTTILSLSALASIILGFSTSQDQKWAFYVALLGSTLQGCMQSLGEVNILGFAKSFPPSLISAWSSGTGMAGPFGSGVYLLLTGIGVKDLYIFLCLVPCQLIYYWAFSWLENKRIQNASHQETIIETQKIAETNDEDVVEITNKQLTYVNVKKALFQYSGWYSLNFGLVYLLEYTCIVLWADRANPKTDEKVNFFQDNTFAILGFSYQIGVFISRSSLQLIRIKQIHFLTLIQAINTLIWIYIAITKSFGVGIQIPFMVFVGLMGGAAYVNIAYSILSSEVIPKEMKELCLNINAICSNIGITIATLITIIVDNIWT